MSKSAYVWLVVFAIAQPKSLSAANGIGNGEFTGGLSQWITSGTLFNTGDTAVFSDSVSTPLALFQSSAVPGSLVAVELSFDILNGMSSVTTSGFLPDSFFATLYLGSSAFGTNLPGGVFDQAIALFDMDASGPFNTASGATFSPSPKGAGWSRFTLTLDTAPAFTGPGHATVAFEFYNLNGTGSDSVVAVDNVSLITIVPKPSSALLLFMATASLIVRRKRSLPSHLS